MVSFVSYTSSSLFNCLIRGLTSVGVIATNVMRSLHCGVDGLVGALYCSFVSYSWWMRSFPTVGVPQADGLVSRTMPVLNVLRLHGRSSSFPRRLHWCKKMVTTLFFVSEVSHQNNHRSAPPSHPPRCVQFVAETKRLIFLQLLFSDLSSNRSSRSVSSPSRPPSSCSSLPTTSHQS